MTDRFFVTGTDTDVGKTTATCALLTALGKTGLKTLGLKPIASGLDLAKDNGINEDTRALCTASTVKLDATYITPIRFEPFIAPHIAAEQAGVSISVSRLMTYYDPWPLADITLIEGAGGWHVPLNASENYSDYVSAMQLPVILVVAMRLGCLNHALLTVEAIRHAGLQLAGWIANDITGKMPYFEENLETLSNRINAPLLGVLNYQHNCAADTLPTFRELNLQPLLHPTPTVRVD